MSRNSLLETGAMSEVYVAVTSDIAPALSKDLLDIQATIERRFTLKCVRDIEHTVIIGHILKKCPKKGCLFE